MLTVGMVIIHLQSLTGLKFLSSTEEQMHIIVTSQI